MTPQEILKGFITDLENSESAETPEIKAMIEQLSVIEQSGDEKRITETISGLLKLGGSLPALGEEKAVSLPAKPEQTKSDERFFEWAVKNIGDNYQEYKRRANVGIIIGAVFLLALWVISLFFSTGETVVKITNQYQTSSYHSLLKFTGIDKIFVFVLALKWFLFIPIGFMSWATYDQGEGASRVRRWYKKFGVELILVLMVIGEICIGFDIVGDSLLYFTYSQAIVDLVTFIGRCAVISLVVYFFLNRAKVGSEAKLYFTTFGIELIINTIRLYILFVLLYIPIFIGTIFYISYQGAIHDNAWNNVPFEVAGFWGWWIPLIFGSLNLAMSLGIFFGWDAPISGIKLSFDAREPTNEEKDYIIMFYRRLVESGRSDERVFKSWNVIESVGVFAFTYGENIFISRGSFTERYFNALVAHEIGHLHQRDGLVLQALHSFTYPFFNHLLFNPTSIQRGVIEPEKDYNKPNFLLSGILSSMTITFFTLSFGGWSVQALARFWSRFYINRDYLADDYALSLGFGYELLSYLESYKDFDTALPLFNRWRGYTRVRIERIKQKIEMSV